MTSMYKYGIIARASCCVEESKIFPRRVFFAIFYKAFLTKSLICVLKGIAHETTNHFLYGYTAHNDHFVRILSHRPSHGDAGGNFIGGNHFFLLPISY